eukprot:TRINITY_DN7146_c0_g1_i2.p1 TRINITY_DN7146_c0_g1~~TRINITY_DN7146_c0_g1_i2.p1  ORF type:complete len:296 (+),score=38.71 TRINITY_DN7146_c0_g1_i2:345-1232(+)
MCVVCACVCSVSVPTASVVEPLRFKPDPAHLIRPLQTDKVAICLSGGIRTFRTTHQNIYDMLVKPNNADVFAHVYAENEDHNAAVEFMRRTPWVTDVRQEPYDLTLEMQMQAYHNASQPLSTPSKRYSQFRKVHLCLQLVFDYEMRTGIRYKYIARARPDMNYSTPIVINNHTCPEGKICLPKGARQNGRPALLPPLTPSTNCSDLQAFCNCCSMAEDYFAVGDRHMMYVYASAYWLMGIAPQEHPLANYQEHLLYNVIKFLGYGDRDLYLHPFNVSWVLVRTPTHRLKSLVPND